MAVGVSHASAPRLPRYVVVPFSQSTACIALRSPTAFSQIPEIPTTCPLLLIAVAALSGSLPNGGSARFWPGLGPQITASNWSTCGSTQVGSCTGVSAQPTTCPTSLAPEAYPFTPPRVGRGLIITFCQTNPRQMCPVTVGKKTPQ